MNRCTVSYALLAPNLAHKRLIALVLTLLYLLPIPGLAGQHSRSPNIILIVADYMGYSDIEPYGSDDIKTPSLVALAKQGIQFTDHYSASPTCIRSRAALMSGLYPSKVLERFKQRGGKGLAAGRNNLLIQLKAGGYTTALVGKWHLGMESRFKPTDHGFDYFFGFDSWALGYHNHLTPDGDPGLYRNNNLVAEKGYLTHLFSKEATQFIDKNTRNPFFLYLSYNGGLPPYQRADLPLKRWGSGWDANSARRSDYVSMVETMDQGIGQVLSKLRELGLENDTLVIFTYDHGGRHLVNSKPLFHGFATLWEGGIRVPLIMRWPNHVKKNTVFSNPTVAMDVTATMIDAARRGPPKSHLDGLNLINVIKTPDTLSNRSLFWRFGKMKAVRKGNWKYIIDNRSQLLFNLDDDISERKNMFYHHPEKVSMLKNSIVAWESTLTPQ